MACVENPWLQARKMALFALEKAPFSAIFPLPILGGGQSGPRAENRVWGQREARLDGVRFDTRFRTLMKLA